jgi:hypothetical protein
MNLMPQTGAETTSPMSRKILKRVNSTAKKHWLAEEANDEQKAVIEEIRRQYHTTASEYYKSALYIYDSLGVQAQKRVSHKIPLSLANRNVQLFIAYSILWEAFNHIYTAASYTAFARNGQEQETLEEERAKIERVLNPPILSDEDFTKVGPLKNGESPNGAINRIVNRSSREVKEIYGIGYDQTLTDMNAFLQGVIEVTETKNAAGEWEIESENGTWLVKALDQKGQQIDPESGFSAEKYRSVIKWHCYQIRNNLNFVGKSDGSLEDAVLILRAFCLLEPVVALLLQDNKKPHIFAI